MGDFNMPNVDWVPDSVSFQSNHVSECFEDNFLTNVVNKPTLGKNILDLVLVKDPSVDLSSWLMLLRAFGGRTLPQCGLMLLVFLVHGLPVLLRVNCVNLTMQSLIGIPSRNKKAQIDLLFFHVMTSESIHIRRKTNFVQGIPAFGEVKKAYRHRKRIFKLCSNSDSDFATCLRAKGKKLMTAFLEL